MNVGRSIFALPITMFIRFVSQACRERSQYPYRSGISTHPSPVARFAGEVSDRGKDLHTLWDHAMISET